MKLAKKAEETIQDDPRSVRDPVIHKRLELMVFDDAIPHTWGCMFYRFLRKHKLGSEDAIAGNQYFQLVKDHDRLQETDPDELPEHQRELAYRRIRRAKKRCNEIREHVIGFGRRILDPLLFDEVYPTSEKEHIIAKLCLANLKIYFATGTKRQRNVV